MNVVLVNNFEGGLGVVQRAAKCVIGYTMMSISNQYSTTSEKLLLNRQALPTDASSLINALPNANLWKTIHCKD